jgi:hypothetical protein
LIGRKTRIDRGQAATHQSLDLERMMNFGWTNSVEPAR